MNFSSPFRIVGLLVGLLFTMAAATAADGVLVSVSSDTYTVTNLSLIGEQEESASGMNASGQVIVGVIPGNPPPSPGQGVKDAPTGGYFISKDNKLQYIGNLGQQRMAAFAINDSGQVVGHADVEPLPTNPTFMGDPAEHVFLYEKGKISDLGTLGGKNSRAYDINASGQIVGQADTANSGSHAFLYHNGKMQDLDIHSEYDSDGLLINAAGQIAGVVDMGPAVLGGAAEGPPQHAFLYRDGKLHDIGTFGGKTSWPTAINAAGDVVGRAEIASTTMASGPFTPPISHAFLYRNEKIQDLGTLGGKNSSANAINDAGQIVGASDVNVVTLSSDPTVSPTRHAFLYSNGKMQDLGSLNAKNSEAVAINSSGQVVGVLRDGYHFEDMRAFLYDKGKMQDLTLLVGEATLAKAGIKVLVTAKGINDRGQIFGIALDKDGKKAAYILTPAKSSPFVIP